MPLYKLKRVWEYCSYNKKFFVFILILIFILNLIPDLSRNLFGFYVKVIMNLIISVILNGYGMSITRDRINHGYRLPKILPKKILNLGFKSIFVYVVYFGFQILILKCISDFLGFPIFNMEHMLMDFHGTASLLFAHHPVYTIIFFAIGAIVFYVTTFFAEIGLAKLADTKSLLPSFDLRSIFKSIELFGWVNYARDITSIIVAIVILSYLKSVTIPVFWVDGLWEMFFGFLIFATQYLGIGAVYCNIKDMETAG